MTTKRSIQTFFPASFASLNATSIGSILYNHILLPDTVAERCPEVKITIGSGGHTTILRQPVLLVVAISGVVIGVRGFWSLPKYWSLGFGAFAIMNIDTICLHCLWPSIDANDTYPERYPILWTIDTYSTGVASVALSIALLERWTSQNLSRSFWILQAVGILCILLFYVDPPLVPIAASFPLELWYGISLLLFLDVGLLVIFGDLFVNRKAFCWTMDHVFLLISGAFPLLGIVMDGFWCRIFETLLADLPTSLTFMFLGCDLMMWGFYRWIQSSESKKHMD